MKEPIEFIEIVEKVSEMFAENIPGYVCVECGEKYFAIYTDQQGDLIIAHPKSKKLVYTNSCSAHINFDLIIKPDAVEPIIFPKPFKNLSNERVIVTMPVMAKLFVGNRLN